MSETISYAIFRSIATVPASSIDEARIYLSSRANNERLRITGYISREGDTFLQYIEGPRDNLATLMRSIRIDWRHRNVDLLLEGRGRRLFSDWRMAFFDDGTHDLVNLLVGQGDEAALQERLLDYVRGIARDLATEQRSGAFAGALGEGLVHRRM